MTNLTPSPTNLLATDTPCLGSDTSSPCSRVSFCPRMPPALLMSSTACCVPLTSCAPKAAFGPVIGPATPILIWALAAPENARAARSATPDNQCLVIHPTPISLRTPGPPWRPLAEDNSTLKADTFLFLVKSHLKKHKDLSIWPA